MKAKNIVEKRIYSIPEIVCVELDNAISLALESNPPLGPEETYNSVQSPFNDDSGLV